MDTEHANAESNYQAGDERVAYHAPKFVALGPIQAVVQASPGPSTDDGGGTFDGTASGV
jgi:hypothetical protein